MSLSGRPTIISGAGSGISRATTLRFAEEGARVLVLELDHENGQSVVNEIEQMGGTAAFYQLDVSNWKQVEDVFGDIDAKYSNIDVLYNNAAVFWGEKDAAIDELDVEVLEQIIKINLFGTMYCSKAVIPLLKKRQGGSIIHTSSSCGIIGVPNCDAYSASKGGIISLTRSMAVEYGPDGIRTNCIAPAAIHTPMIYESDLNKDTFDEQEFLSKGTPLRKWGRSEDISNIALFLASDESSYMNGAILVADGGITIS